MCLSVLLYVWPVHELWSHGIWGQQSVKPEENTSDPEKGKQLEAGNPVSMIGATTRDETIPAEVIQAI